MPPLCAFRVRRASHPCASAISLSLATLATARFESRAVDRFLVDLLDIVGIVGQSNPERSVPTVLSWPMCRWQRMGRTRWAAPTDRPAELAQEMNITQQWIFGRWSARASSLMAMHAGDISEDEYWPTFRGADGDFHSRHRPSSGP